MAWQSACFTGEEQANGEPTCTEFQSWRVRAEIFQYFPLTPAGKNHWITILFYFLSCEKPGFIFKSDLFTSQLPSHQIQGEICNYFSNLCFRNSTCVTAHITEYL